MNRDIVVGGILLSYAVIFLSMFHAYPGTPVFMIWLFVTVAIWVILFYLLAEPFCAKGLDVRTSYHTLKRR